MELKEVLAITGKRGLYRFVARSRHGFVVEPLEGGARFAVSMMSRVSSLADIASYVTLPPFFHKGSIFSFGLAS